MVFSGEEKDIGELREPRRWKIIEEVGHRGEQGSSRK